MSSVTGPVSASFPRRTNACVLALIAVACALLSYACQSSSQQITAPSGQKCQISVPTSLPPVGPEGGSGTLTITAARECAWTVASGVPWITIAGNRTGQGSGTVTYTAAGNPAPAARRGTLNVDDQQIELLQEAAPCQFTFTPPALAVESPGGENVVTVATIDGCAWTAVSESNWIEVVGSAERSGAGQVQIRTQPNPGPARTGQLRIAGQIYSVTQGSTTPSACAPAVASPERTAPAGGTTLSVGVTAPGGCVWSATSHASWITVTEGATGTGNGNVALVVAANTGPQRVGLVTVANVTVTVTQTAGAPAAWADLLVCARFDRAVGAGGRRRGHRRRDHHHGLRVDGHHPGAVDHDQRRCGGQRQRHGRAHDCGKHRGRANRNRQHRRPGLHGQTGSRISPAAAGLHLCAECFGAGGGRRWWSRHRQRHGRGRMRVDGRDPAAVDHDHRRRGGQRQRHGGAHRLRQTPGPSEPEPSPSRGRSLPSDRQRHLRRRRPAPIR